MKNERKCNLCNKIIAKNSLIYCLESIGRLDLRMCSKCSNKVYNLVKNIK